MTTTATTLDQTKTGAAELVRTARLEWVLVVSALIVIAVHVVDDSFLQPQPGTSAGDHLVSGLVPVAVLLGVAAVYPRLAPGLRATVLALLGLFGIVAGIDDDVRWRYVRRLLLAVASVVGVYLFVAPFLVTYVLTHTARAFVPVDQIGAPHQDVSFKTADGLRLRGWYVPSKNGAAVISFPGRKGTQKPARFLAAHGYGVLVFDRRGEGESDGDPNAWGWEGYRDVDAAVAFLRQRPDVEQDRIGGIGLSVGGEMMLEAAARSRGLKAVVSEGAGERSIREFLDMTVASKWFAAPQYTMLTAGTSLFSNHTAPPSLKDLVGRIAPTPVFFIYGEHGQDGERNLNPIYFAEARAPKQIWEVPDSGHVGGVNAHPKAYDRRVTGFFDRNLLGDGRQ